MKIDHPYISIIQFLGVHRERAEQSLALILDQKGIENAEILIFDEAFERYPPLTGSDRANVKIHPLRGSLPFGHLRTNAVELARGEVVAFVEDHAYVRLGWLETLIHGFQAGHAGVGGTPRAVNPGVGISDAITLINYGFFYPVTEPRTHPILPGHNSAYRRDVLLSFGDLLPMLLTSEALLNHFMINKGHILLLDPGAEFLHQNEESLSMALRGYYYSNLSLGESRARLFGWPWWRRLFQALSTPLVPFMRYIKYGIHLWVLDRQSLPTLFRYTGVFFYTQSVAAVGLAIGCLFGAGDADVRFRDYELNTSRKLKLPR